MKRIDRIWLDGIISPDKGMEERTWTSCLISPFFPQALSASRAKTIDYFVPSTAPRQFFPVTPRELREGNDKNGSEGWQRNVVVPASRPRVHKTIKLTGNESKEK